MNTSPLKIEYRRARSAPARLPGVLTLIAALLCAAASAQDDELGRLFFTPERRQSLDRQRQLNLPERQGIPDDPTLTINGVVTRGSDVRTVWINGVAQNDSGSGVAVNPKRKDPGKVVVRTTHIPAANARVGETVNRDTGEVEDLLGGGRISVRTGEGK